jgi:pSer/pThr/pTyr-binding forkhead associated (FHA) protein
MNGAEDGRIIECAEFPITMGRASDNMAHLPYDHLISRNHAKIERNQNTLTLCDLKSTNGTFFHEKRVKEDIRIGLNKIFRVGATLLTIRLHSSKD